MACLMTYVIQAGARLHRPNQSPIAALHAPSTRRPSSGPTAPLPSPSSKSTIPSTRRGGGAGGAPFPACALIGSPVALGPTAAAAPGTITGIATAPDSGLAAVPALAAAPWSTAGLALLAGGAPIPAGPPTSCSGGGA